MENRSTPVRGRSATWALGSLAVFFCAVEALTGLGLVLDYRPAADSAYASVLGLRQAGALGWLSKLHHWGSHALVIVVWLHLVRTFVSGRYRSRHRRHWTLGVALLVPILALAATGARLPMDAYAVASLAARPPALSAGASEPQAPELGDDDLWRLYVLHCMLLPVAAAPLVFVHVRQARRDAVLPPVTDPSDVSG